MPQGKGRSSPLRLLILTLIMLFFAAASFLPSLFARHGTGLTSTSLNIREIFIPVWISLTIVTVIISFYFARDILTAERSRDSEAPAPAEAPHSH